MTTTTTADELNDRLRGDLIEPTDDRYEAANSIVPALCPARVHGRR